MQKKLGQKRRLKQSLNACVPLVMLFLGTLGVLFVCGFIFHQRGLISPIGKAYSSVIHVLDNNSKAQIIDLASRYHIPIGKLQLTDTSATLTTDNNLTIIFSTQKDLEKQFASLQLIQKQLTIEGKSAKMLDFRFDNPVVTF